MKALLTLLILGMTCAAGLAQDERLHDPVPYFMAVIVSDMDTSAYWYTSYLGFEVRNSIENEERGYKIKILEQGDALIELIELSSAVSLESFLQGQPPGTRTEGFFKFGFTVPDFDEWMKFLQDAGVEFHGSVVRDDFSGKKMVIVRDPDGNRIQLFER